MFSFTTGDKQGTQESHKNQGGGAGNELEIEPHFGDNVELFDNEELFPDLDLVVQGLDAPLHLHKIILTKTSKLMEGLIKTKHMTNSQNENQVEWMFDTSEKVDRDALLNVLRFCYGEKMRVGKGEGECCAVIAALFRLQVTCTNEIIAKLTDFTVNCAKEDLAFGAMMLKDAQRYPECRDQNACGLNQALAKVVLTSKNICEHSEVVSECLLNLPPEFLDLAEFGDPHTKWSEFNMRVEYLKEHCEVLQQEEKDTIMRKCKLTFLRSEELKQLRRLNLVGKDVMLDMCESVLEHIEKEKSANDVDVSRIIRERDELKKRAEKAEKERDEERAKSKKEQNTKTVVKKNPEEPPASENPWSQCYSYGIPCCGPCCEIGVITLKDSWGRTQKIDTRVRELDLSSEKKQTREIGIG